MDQVKPRRHVERRFWTFDDVNDPNALPVSPEHVPVPGDGVHDGEEDDYAYAAHKPLPVGSRWPTALQQRGED